MAGIVSVGEKYEGARSGSINRLWQRNYVRTFIVETTRPQIGALQVRTAVDPRTGLAIPQPGAFYHNGLSPGDPDFEYDHGSFVESIEATQDQDTGGLQWTVVVNYAFYTIFDPDPTLWPIRVSFGGDRTERVIYFDFNGNPIVNSAGDRFDPPITIDDSRSTMTVTRNERVTAFDLTLAETYRDTINSAPWNGFAAHTVKLGIITTSEPQYDSNNLVYYYTVTYPFMIDRGGWRKEILDAGCNQLKVIGGITQRVPIQHEGHPVSDPVALDGSGHELAPGGTPTTLILECYTESDFSGLGIDLSTRLGM